MLLQNRYDLDARVKREARSLAEQRDLHVIYLCGVDETERAGHDGRVEIEGLNLFTRVLPSSSLFWILKFAEFCLRIAWRAARRRPDAYHAHDLPMMIPAYLASKIHPAPIVYDAHELYSETGQDPPAIERFWRYVDKWAVRRARRVIAVNESRALVMTNELGSPPPVVVPNYPLFQPAEDLLSPLESPLRKFVNAKGHTDVPIVLYQGILAAGRELEKIVEAMTSVRSSAVLVLLGPRSRYLDDLMNLVDSMHLEERVLYHEGVNSDELPAYTAGADVGVVTYANTPRNNYLCAPNKLFEYCMAQVPVVGCDFPEITRLLDEYAAGERFVSGDPASIARSIDRLLGNPERMEEARRMTIAVREKYHWGRAAKDLEGVYDEIFSAVDENAAS